VRRRPILIATDIGSALLLASVPLATAWHMLTVTQLAVTGFLIGALSVTFDVAYPAFLPSVVPPGRLVDGNGLMEGGANAAQVAGPSLGGVLVQVVGAPVALLADAVSFLVSASALATIRVPETHTSSVASADGGPRPSLRADIADGLRYVVHEPSLRALVTSVAVANFIFGGYAAVVLVFYARQLGLPAAVIGVIVAVAGIGGIVGSLGAGLLARRIGDARLLWMSTIVTTPLLLLVPLGRPGGWLALPVIGVVGANAAIAAFNVCVRAALQRNVPPALLGRVTASIDPRVQPGRVAARCAHRWRDRQRGDAPTSVIRDAGVFCGRTDPRMAVPDQPRPYAGRSGHPGDSHRSGHGVSRYAGYPVHAGSRSRDRSAYVAVAPGREGP
jgi:MFS family permease